MDAIAASRTLFLSPHLDDAVFACGRLLASCRDAVVATIFAGRAPAAVPLTEWDRASGFDEGDDVVGARRAEDRAALAVLGATPVWRDFPDDQYGARPSREVLVRALEQLLDEWAPAAVFVPFGLFHADHRLLHEAALQLAARRPAPHWFAYEEPMYRRIPGARDQRIAALAAARIAAEPFTFADAPGADARKREAAACYRSQLRGLASPGRPGHHDVFEPERYWRIRPMTTP